MASDVFLDSSGLFALLVHRDEHHRTAERIVQVARSEKRRLVTTDYVLDETATLLKARGLGHLVEPMFEHVLSSAACRTMWTDEGRFGVVRKFFAKHADQAWSFTDCLSFCVMKELRLREALATDVHFEQAGFKALLRRE
jgi:predicted nucleic acid-binding protein